MVYTNDAVQAMTEEELLMSCPYSDVARWERILEGQYLSGGSKFTGPPGMQDRVKEQILAEGFESATRRHLRGERFDERTITEQTRVASVPFSWHDKYLIGHTAIDAQHRELFESVGKFIGAKSRYGQVLCAKTLYDKARAHFDFEEQLMAQIKYLDAERHIDHHDDLLSKLDSLTHEIADHSFDTANLQAHLTAWLIDHILTSDADLAVHLHVAMAR